ncbi:23S rRNA (adenine(2030)-N(6))-methyltransferase RlmJ [Methylovirgula ligni]|uniref:Ribosomal RNA large subunit methyltransferase J n=1 Tax=Methylovirgula ligni TaxID=569860 RepID=A0A3D9YXL9_9HYPH|nr:23S rRNA (adenine(2030)-N(6))-methyltransferase RlmJ [Methylovirgula ligni]QAY94614.1 23S rRNA (adenine(2030)-N(6))-methyltransferase RlmJ [Methylovirgula ligni]REF87514.1 23S rRNA (adenine2030-N6)-methyltransferase [Methylovirgula ligni]
MNYRHAFHAGNFADVFKHAILTRLLVYLCRKETPFRVIDTHAGEGIYDLSDERAEKTAEWRGGIGRLLESPPPSEVAALLEPYLALVRPLISADPPLYPGSPALAQKLTRPQDRMIFCDVHPEVIPALKARLGRDARVKIVEIDGYMALNAFVPPRERRGLVLVDPPFESKSEFEALKAALLLAVARWPTGTFAIWFPIKDPSAVAHFVSALEMELPRQGVKNVLYLRLGVAPPRPDAPLAASGLIILNPPFTLDVEARLILPYLAKTMATMGRGDVEVAWLAKH